MRHFHFAIAIITTIGLTTSAFADEKQRRPGAEEFRAQLLKEFDADGDGKLNEGERTKARASASKKRGGKQGGGRPDRAQMMKKFDKDGDGKLSESERAAARAAMEKRGGGKRGGGKQRPGANGNRIPPEVLKRFDKDGDGKLNEAERKVAMKAREEFMKKNGGQGRPDRKEMMAKFDTNGDGKLDEAERAKAREAMGKRRGGRDGGGAAKEGGKPRKPRVDRTELLEKFDADGDGKLSDSERAKAREEFKNRKK
jgi:Ca2+-binding EF-hand superfamily protein